LCMPSAERFCESRMRDILTSGSTRGEAVVPTVSLPLLLYLRETPAMSNDFLSELLTQDTVRR
ncbi:MAG: hypothetical protein ABSF46_33680, partial [Terriglobia bacterium]